MGSKIETDSIPTPAIGRTSLNKYVQGSLAQLGYYKGNIDGSIGPVSKRAITKFQTVTGLKPDGVLGPNTLGALATKVPPPAAGMLPPLKLKPNPYVNFDYLQTIESNNNPYAISNKMGLGLRQVTPVVLDEWKQQFPQYPLEETDLLDPNVNKIVSEWYMDRLVNHYAPVYDIHPTTANLLSMYNMGPSGFRDVLIGKDKLPNETRDYVNKYSKLENTAKPESGMKRVGSGRKV